MLSPNLTLTVQFLKSLTTTVVLKKLNPRGRHRRSRGNPISSSLPRHGARIRTKNTQKIERKKNKIKGRLQVSTKKYIEQKLYDVWIIETSWCMTECNAIKSKLSSNSQNWLEHRVSNKKPKKKKKFKPLECF